MDWRVTLISEIFTGIILPEIFVRKIFLNQDDMQRMHAQALQNPLYEALWKKVEAFSPTSLEFAPLSSFLRPGLSKNEVSLAYYNAIDKKIRIYHGTTELYAFSNLIFESANAYQIKMLRLNKD